MGSSCVASCHRLFPLISFFFSFLDSRRHSRPRNVKNRSGAGAYKKEPVSGPLLCPPPPLPSLPPFVADSHADPVTRAQSTKIKHTMYVQPKGKKEKEENDRSVAVRNVVRNDFLRFFATCPRASPNPVRFSIKLRRDRSTIDYDRTTGDRSMDNKEVSAAVPATGRWYSVCFCVGSLGNNK